MWRCPKCRQVVDDSFEICWACGTTIEGVEDPHFFDEPTKGPSPNVAPDAPRPENLVTVAKCSLPGEAHAIRVRLESEGIPVFLFDEFTIAMDWLLSNAIGGVKVQVSDYDLERAREILGIVEEQADNEQQTSEVHDEEADQSTADTQPEEGIIDKGGATIREAGEPGGPV
jgi:hypothetical protein